MILVTPYIVRPVSVASTLHTPLDGFNPPNDFDRAILLRQRARGPDEGRQLGDTGFLLN